MELQSRTANKPNFLSQYAAPFRTSRAFPYLWLGQLISFLGSSITMIILPVVVYTLTGSTKTMGFVMAAYMLPNVVMLPISGWIVDRYNRTNIMLFTDVIRFIVMGAVAALLFTDSLTIQLLFILVAIYGTMDGLFQPAYSATRATVFTPEIRNSANALTQISNQAVRLIGPSLGGVLVTFLSAGWGITIDALSYIASFFCLFFLRKLVPFHKKEVNVHAENEQQTSSNLRTDFVEGLQILKGNPWLWITIVAFSFVNICYGGLTVVLIPWLFKVHLHLSPYIYGVTITCSGAGAILAGLLFGMRSGWRNRGLLAYGGALLSGIALLFMSFTTSAIGLCVLFAIEGFGLMLFGLIWETSLQELVPQEAFGRVASLDMLGSFALLPLGYVVVGWLADVIGGTQTMMIFATIGIASIIFVLMIPSIRKFD
ncbi:MFS family permease [Fontibacillus solani]|uniref:MFS family permease n=1 Tax=Fontibacillus solani TaxID=1572857 RepID=A0A7W3SS99_9BACL|nr:MFS transporter [Fontibacillus solani]MBA9085332.1 MFS family permease [Fontibacillus solani]